MLRLVVVIVALVLGLAFHSRNHQAVSLDFYLRTFEIPLSWVVVAALSLGALLGILALTPRLLRARRALRREQKRANLLQSQIPVAPVSPPAPAASAELSPTLPDGN